MQDEGATYRVLMRRALASQDPVHLQAHFQIGVLDRYLSSASFSVLRTDTVGRLKKEGGWTLDFGIAPSETALHVSIGELMRLPADDREYWSQYVVAAPSSAMFLQMRLAPGSCFDDGELRRWQ